MAGTVIDSLFMTLGLDDTQYLKGAANAIGANKKLRDDAAKTAKDVSGPNKLIGDSFGRIKTELLGLAAVAAGGAGLKALFANTVSVDAATGRMANNIGMATRELSAWQNMAVQAGGSAQGMASSIMGISQAMQQTKMGIQNSIVPVLQRYMGIKLTDGAGHERSMSDIMLDVADWMHSHSAQQDNAIGSMLGFDQGTINTLEQGRGVLAPGLAAQSSTNERQAKAAEDLITAFGKLEVQVDNFAGDIMVDIAPALLREMGNFTRGLSIIDQVMQGKLPMSALVGDFWNGIGGPAAVNDVSKLFPGVGETSKQQDAVGQQIVSYFEGKGLNPTQAAAVAGALYTESNFDPTAVNPKSGAAGINQLLGDRAKEFKARYGVTPDKATLAQQLDFMWWELNHSEKGALSLLKNSDDPSGLAGHFLAAYERPWTGDTPPEVIEQTKARANAEARKLAGTPGPLSNVGQAVVSAQSAVSAWIKAHEFSGAPSSYGKNNDLTGAINAAAARNAPAHISTTVGDIHIHMPAGTKADPNTLSAALRQRLLHQGLIPPANTALQ